MVRGQGGGERPRGGERLGGGERSRGGAQLGEKTGGAAVARQERAHSAHAVWWLRSTTLGDETKHNNQIWPCAFSNNQIWSWWRGESWHVIWEGYRLQHTCKFAQTVRANLKFAQTGERDEGVMPNLTWLGRRWCLASDDLFVPASWTAAVRSIGGLLLWLQWCGGISPSLRLACLATHVANAAAILLELLIIRQSTRGAVVDCDSRDRAVRPLLTAHLVLSLGEMCLGVVVATQVEFAAADSCGVSLFLLRASLLAYLCFIVCGLTLLATLMKSGHAHEVAAEGSNPNPNPDPNPNSSPGPSPNPNVTLTQVAAQGWAKRWIKGLCVCVRLDETAERVLVQCLTAVWQLDTRPPCRRLRLRLHLRRCLRLCLALLVARLIARTPEAATPLSERRDSRHQPEA